MSVIIDDKTIEEIARIIEDAFKKAGRENELEKLCDSILTNIPPKSHSPYPKITPHEHRNLTAVICPICEALPDANHEVCCPRYGLWDTDYTLPIDD